MAVSGGRQPYCARSIVPAGLTFTASFLSMARCSSKPPPGGKDICPFTLTTRCQGSPLFSESACSTRTTCRAARGLPASAAIWPYEATFPLGTRRRISMIRVVSEAASPASCALTRAASFAAMEPKWEGRGIRGILRALDHLAQALPVLTRSPAPPPDRHPVLLVHGIWKSGAAFRVLARHLEKRGFEVHTLDLVPNDGRAPLEQLAEQVAGHVASALPAGAPFDLVGFSMGGLVSRYYLQRLGGVERVRRFVSVSAPHRGTLTAYLQKRAGALQMRPGSAFLRDLDGDVATLDRLDVTSIWTPLDLMILPPESSRLPVGREVLVAAPLHALMLRDPRALRAVAEALSAPLNRCRR